MTSLSCHHMHGTVSSTSQLLAFPLWNLPWFLAEGWVSHTMGPPVSLPSCGYSGTKSQRLKNHSLFHKGVFTAFKIKPAWSPGWEERNIFSVLVSEVGVFLELLFHLKSQQVHRPNALFWAGQCLPPLCSRKPSSAMTVNGKGSGHFHYIKVEDI